ncbi:MAG TPA: protein kinase [Gemmatimonadaceae bacterium]|nr:protein kinase [Gemmatimonadaceae bacterium]
MTDTLAAALGGSYRIERELGQGGMATVYLAHDRKHDRKVAVKVLRPDLAAVIGAERFLREIKTIATLQHPHILGLIDSGEVDGTAYYVMPYVDGESLRDRLKREKQLPIPEAVQIASEVASALDYAHRHGVIHRDIKPENILLHDGSALVADFGIALAASRGGGGRMTETGMSLGTPTYMAPEQAMGERDITARADVYALGATTYEMLTGDPPFSGSTAQAIVAKVMTERPRPIFPQRDTVPPAVEQAVLTALEKLPADRFATAAQFADALHATGAAPGSRRTGAPAGALTGRARVPLGARFRDPLVLGFAAAAIAAVAFAVLGRRPAPDDPPAVIRFTLPASPTARTNVLGLNMLNVSPDGRTLLYAAQGSGRHEQLVLRPLDDIASRPLPGTEDAGQPTFSPDGRWVLFIRGNQLYKVSLDGGDPQVLGSAPGTFAGASWSTTGVIVLSGNRSLYLMPEAGGQAREFGGGTGRPQGELFTATPLVIDSARCIIYTSATSATVSTNRIAIASMSGGQATVLDLPGLQPLGVVDNTLVYATTSGTIMGVPIDLAKRRLLGAPVQLLDNVVVNLSTGLARAALSHGTLVYQSGSQLSQVVMVGRGETTRTLLADRRDYLFPRLSPDGRRLAITIGAGDRRDIWLDDLASGTLTRLTSEGSANERPEWSPDGTRVLYRSDRGSRTGIYWRPADLSADATPLVLGKRVDVYEGVMSPDARYIAYQLDTLGADLYYRALTGDTTPHPIAANPSAIEIMPRISPNGKWIAFTTDESGRNEVVVQPFPGPGGRVQVSVNGGAEPVWSRDGRRLFYRGDGMLMAATLGPGPAFSVVRHDSVLTDTYVFAGNPHANYDVMPDGTHFIFLKSADDGELVVVSNWDAVVRARMKAAR